ncbi:MAG: serine/threonine protein kinase [Anaerolineaceae bacterium]|nr:serine/threonine protein kinase [Anaerolineaceae bacterium]
MPLPLKTGDLLRGRYRIQKIIGQGGSGSIYLASDMRLEGRQCALKEVEHDRNLTEELMKEARDQFLREATVLARLDHQNLPKVSDFFSINFRDYLVMDFVPGEDLRTLMLDAKRNNEFLNETDVLNWMSQLCDALIYLHEQNTPILHRDIKPSNLKLTPSGLLKLVDFGLVKVAIPGEITITIVQGQGTALYTPLEQYGGDTGHTDVRSDIYALGATMYHLLTNTNPIDARTRFLSPKTLLPPRAINSMISIRTEKAILWALSLHPDERPENVRAFLGSLIGDRPTITRPINKNKTAVDIIKLLPERILVWVVFFLVLLSLILSIS